MDEADMLHANTVYSLPNTWKEYLNAKWLPCPKLFTCKQVWYLWRKRTENGIDHLILCTYSNSKVKFCLCNLHFTYMAINKGC